MITKLQNINKTDLNGMSREDVFRLLSVLGEWKTDDDKNSVYRTDIERMSKESGSPTVNDFLIRLGYIPNPTVKKPRVKITTKYGVTEDAIYNIKGKSGLTKPKTKKVPTPTVTVPTPTVTVNPTTVPSPIVSVSVSESVSPSNVTPMVQSPELKKEVV
jgi:cytochrome oxidase assembly protein ShyY1